MATYAHVQDGTVVNIVCAEPYGAQSLQKIMTLIETDKPVAIGDSYDGSKFYRDGVEVLTPFEATARELDEYYNAMQEVVEA